MGSWSWKPQMEEARWGAHPEECSHSKWAPQSWGSEPPSSLLLKGTDSSLASGSGQGEGLQLPEPLNAHLRSSKGVREETLEGSALGSEALAPSQMHLSQDLGGGGRAGRGRKGQ